MQAVRNAKALLNRVDNIAKGAALMTDTTMSCRQIDGTANTLSNQILEQLLHDNQSLGQANLAFYSRAEMEKQLSSAELLEEIESNIANN